MDGLALLIVMSLPNERNEMPSSSATGARTAVICACSSSTDESALMRWLTTAVLCSGRALT